MKDLNKARIYASLGEEKYLKQEYSESIVEFRRSLDCFENWSAYFGLGWALFKTGNFLEAVDVFEKSIELQKYMIILII